MRKNEHPGCSCRMCRLGRSSNFGQSIHAQTERRIRHKTKQALAYAARRNDPDIEVVTTQSTAYTD